MFTEQERAILALGMTLFTMEAFVGLIAGPMPADVQARDFPVIRRMMDELGSSFGDNVRLDPKLMDEFEEVLRAKAGEEGER